MISDTLPRYFVHTLESGPSIHIDLQVIDYIYLTYF